MGNRRVPLELDDFTGGINLRADQTKLASNELAGALNIEVDPRGGAKMREGWQRWNSVAVTADPWSPQTGFLFQRTFGAPIVMIANNGKLLHSSDGTFSVLQESAADVVVSADWHGADFANWGDEVYIACGATDGSPSHRWDGTGDAVALTPAGAGFWNDDYTVDNAGVMPAAELVTTHLNYLFVANTREDGSNKRNRIRWSHPNSPEDWAEGDEITILNAGAITEIVSMNDHLLIFAELGIWALYGIDSDSWQLNQVTRAVSTLSPNWVAEADNGIYFFSWPHGVHFYDGSVLREVSASLRPAFDSLDFAPGQLSKVFFGWMNRRLWFGAPYNERTAVTDTACVFVLDPSLGSGGSWVRHVGADGNGLGPFIEDRVSSSPKFYGCSRSTADVMRVDAFGSDVWVDDFGGVPAGYQSWFTTRWMNDGISDGKKSWKRASVMCREFPSEHVLRWEAMHDYDESNVERNGQFSVESGSTAVRYGSGAKYGDGSKYSRRAKGAHLERTGNFGSAKAVQLRFIGEVGKPWGVSSITNKFINRRYK